MAEQIPGNFAATTVAVGGYVLGSGVLNVASTAVPFPAVGAYSLVVYDSSLAVPAPRGVLRVSAVNSATQFAVAAEGADFNANAGDAVFGVESEVALAALLSESAAAATAAALAGSYTNVEDEGAPVTQRNILNFAGAGVTVSDSGGKTLVTIPGGGGGGGNVIDFGTHDGRPSPAGLNDGDVYLCTDSPIEYYVNTAAWVARLRGYNLTEAVDSGWTAVNSPAALVTARGGVTLVAAAGAGNNVRAYVKNLPSTTSFTATLRMSFQAMNVNFHRAGLILYESGTGKLCFIGIGISGGVFGVIGMNYQTVTGTSAALRGSVLVPLPLYSPDIIVRFGTAGGTRTYSFSVDNGYTFVTYTTEAVATGFTTAPDQYGFFAESNNATFPCQITAWDIGAV